MIHRDLTYLEYAAIPAWNWSRIKLLELASPLHVFQDVFQDHGDNDTPARVVLRAIHCAVLEPHRFGERYSVFAGTRNASHKLYKSHLACFPGTEVLLPRERDQITATAAAIRDHHVVRDLMAEGEGEVVVTWDDADTGLPCKARIDWLGTKGWFDLKTFGTTHERRVASMAAQQLTHGQLAHYDAGLRANGIELPALLVVAEGQGAQDVAVFAMDEGVPHGALHVGRVLRERLMRELAGCVAEDRWPGRHETVQDLVLPTWALDEVDDDFTFASEE